MADCVPPFPVQLPKQWPTRVRSAILHVISLARISMAATRGWAVHNRNPRIRLKAEIEQLREEIALLQEEIRLEDARMLRVPAHHRPRYSPMERLAILELRAARGWSLAETARRILVTTATVASWMRRLNEEGPKALVQVQVPVNKYPDFVRYIVQRLKVLCPTLGKVKMAQMLSRAGLHLNATTVRRMVRQPPAPIGLSTTTELATKVVTARRPNHVWMVDLTTVPTSFGLWCPWSPFALPQRWPFCWWVAVDIDHYSRRIMGFAVFQQLPEPVAVRPLLGRAIRRAGSAPRHLITDKGTQFTDEAFRRWCRRRSIRQRFGAVGKYGSIAVIERLMLTITQECTRRLLGPFSRDSLRNELKMFTSWYNRHRPHNGLVGATPDEIYRGVEPACCMPRFEPRTKWPRHAPCAAPHAPVRGRRGARLDLQLDYVGGRKHLPIVTLKRAA